MLKMICLAFTFISCLHAQDEPLPAPPPQEADLAVNIDALITITAENFTSIFPDDEVELIHDLREDALTGQTSVLTLGQRIKGIINAEVTFANLSAIDKTTLASTYLRTLLQDIPSLPTLGHIDAAIAALRHQGMI